MSIVKANKISKIYNSSKTEELVVFENISLSLQKDTITSIQGASGVGKSTLLHIMGSIDKPSMGTVTYSINNNEYDLSKIDDKTLNEIRNKHLGFIFQFHHLLPEFNALENVLMPAFISGKGKSSETKALELLDFVGLADRSKHKPSELSGGEQQRVAIARALINDPVIIFADEPTGNLDEKNSATIMELLSRVKSEFNTAMLIATHSKEVAEFAEIKLQLKSSGLENL